MILDDNSDENEALEFGSDDYGSDGSQDEEDVSYFGFNESTRAIIDGAWDMSIIYNLYINYNLIDW